MADIQKKIKLNFAAEGLETISGQMEKMGPLLDTSKEGKRLVENLKTEIMQLQKIGEESGFELGGEAAAQFKKDYLTIINDFQKLRSIVAVPTDPELEKRRLELAQLISEGEAKKNDLENSINAASKKIDLGPDGKAEPSQKLKKSILESQTQMEGLLGASGKVTKVFSTWETGVSKFEKSVESAGLTAIRSQADINKLSKEDQERLEAILKTNGVRWTLQEAGAQIEKKIALEKEAQIQTDEIAKKLNKDQTDLAAEELNIQQAKNDAEKIELQIAENIKATNPNSQVAELGVEITKLSTTLKSQTLGAFEKYNEELKKSKKGQKSVTEEVDKGNNSFQQAAKNVFSYGIAFTALRRIYRETIRTVTELDKALTEMAIVTTMNRQETQMLVGTFQNLAKETGFTTTEIAKLSTVYFRQGRSLRDVIELTTVAAKAARVAGIGAIESANLLTAAVNGFGLAAREAESVSDKFAALAASSASSYQELAVGLSKFASQAKVAGLSLDFAMGLLAKGVETTREAPESIGTALKTVLARMRELTDLGKTLEDGMDVSRVDTALRQIGVNLRDSNGQFRDMQDVLTEVGHKFSTLNKMQQASVAVALAGTRQQSRLLAIFQDFDRTLELVETSEDSAGATMAQHLEYMQGMEASLTNLRTSWQKFITTITESEVVIGIVRTIASTIDLVTDGLEGLGLSGRNAMIAIGLLAGGLKAYSIVQKLSNSDTGIGLILSSFIAKGKAKEAAATAHKMAVQQAEVSLTAAQNIIDQKSIALIDVQIALEEKKISRKTKTLLLSKKEIIEAEIKQATEEKAIATSIISGKVEEAKNKTTLKSIFLKAKDIIVTKLVSLGLMKQTAATLAADAAGKKLNATFYISPLGWVAAGVLAIVGAFLLFKKGAKDAENGTQSFAAGFYKFLNPLIEWIEIGIHLLGELFKILVVYFNETLKPFIVKVLAVVATVISIVVGRILDFVKGFVKVVRFTFTTLVNIVQGFINFYIKAINIAIKGLNLLGANIKEIPLVDLGKEIEKTFDGVEKTIDNISDSVSNFTGNLGDLIDNAKEYRETKIAEIRENQKASKTYEQLAKDIQKVVDKNIAENYELRQKNKQINKLDKEYEKLSKKRIKTDEDLAAIEELRQQVIDFLGEDQIVSLGLRDGETDALDISAALKVMQEQAVSNNAAILENLRESAIETLFLMKKDSEKFFRDPKNIGVVSSYLTAQFTGDLTEEQRRAIRIANEKFLRQFQDSLAEAADDAEREAILDDIFDLSQGYLNAVDDLIRTTKDSNKSIYDQVQEFNSILANFELEDATHAIEALKETFPELNFLVDEFGDRLNNQAFVNLFKQLGFDNRTFNEVSSILSKTSTSVGEFFDLVAREQERLEESGLDSAVAFAQAWGYVSMQVGEEIENATERTQARIGLLNIAIKQSALESTQEIDRLRSSISRLNEVQSQFASGEIAFQDLINFLEDYNLTAQELEDFMLGRDITSSIRQRLQETRLGFLQNIALLQAQLSTIADQNSEEAKGIIAAIQRNQVLYDYGNELKRVTEKQYNYNAALEQQSRFAELGIESDEMRLKVLDATLKLTQERFSETNRSMELLNTELSENFGETWRDYFDVVNGVFIWNYNLLEQHGKEAIAGLQDAYQQGLDENLKYFKELMDQSIEREKAIAEGKKKVYEEYFAALDRLQDQRDRKLSREQLVQQLQRLEGATDERSRQRAKELRAELLKQDQSAAKQTQEEARKNLIEAIDASLENLTKQWQDIYTNIISSGGMAGTAFINILRRAGLIGDSVLANMGGISSNQTSEITGELNGGQIITSAAATMSTGAVIAVFGEEQNQIFEDLTEAISSLSFEGSTNNNSVVIESINITTPSLNSNQDFNRAGASLGDSFMEVINARGLTLNIAK